MPGKNLNANLGAGHRGSFTDTSTFASLGLFREGRKSLEHAQAQPAPSGPTGQHWCPPTVLGPLALDSWHFLRGHRIHPLGAGRAPERLS